jgi:hypothetical protein
VVQRSFFSSRSLAAAFDSIFGSDFDLTATAMILGNHRPQPSGLQGQE